MRRIAIVLVVCASLALALPQGDVPNLESKQTLDDLINQIFTQDNSGVNPNQQNPNSNFNPNPNPNPNPPEEEYHSVVPPTPTPVIIQGGGGANNHQTYEKTPSVPTPSVPPSDLHPSSHGNVSISCFQFYKLWF